MTTLLIPTQSVPLTIDLPAIEPMTVEQFYQFCLANGDLRIERTASGEVIVMSPAFSDTSNRNGKISLQLANWAEQDGTGETFDSSAGFTLPNGATRSPEMLKHGARRGSFASGSWSWRIRSGRCAVSISPGH